MTTMTGTLAGRSVELRRVGIGVALDAQEETNPLRAAFVVLAAAAFWEDTGTRVFADLEAVEAWPMFDLDEVVALAVLAGDVNNKRKPPNGANLEAAAGPPN